MLAAAHEVAEPLLVSGSSDVNGTVHSDAAVQRNCFLDVRGNLKGSRSVEEDAKVVVEGTIDGKVANRGGRLVIHNKGIAEFVAAGVLKIDLSAIALNRAALARRCAGECVDAYGLGIGPVVGGAVGVEDVAAARSGAGQVLCHLGRRFHRVYYAS